MSQLSTTNTVTEYKITLKHYLGGPIYKPNGELYAMYEDSKEYAMETAKEMVTGYVNKYNLYCEAEISEIVRPAWD